MLQSLLMDKVHSVTLVVTSASLLGFIVGCSIIANYIIPLGVSNILAMSSLCGLLGIIVYFGSKWYIKKTFSKHTAAFA